MKTNSTWIWISQGADPLRVGWDGGGGGADWRSRIRVGGTARTSPCSNSRQSQSNASSFSSPDWNFLLGSRRVLSLWASGVSGAPEEQSINLPIWFPFSKSFQLTAILKFPSLHCREVWAVQLKVDVVLCQKNGRSSIRTQVKRVTQGGSRSWQWKWRTNNPQLQV